MNLRSLLLGAAITLLVSAAALLAAAPYVIRKDIIAPARGVIRADFRRHWPEAVRDMRLFAGVFALQPGVDAGDVLNARLKWQTPSGRVAQEGDLDLPAAVRDGLRTAGDRWTELDPALAGGLDFGWMSAVRTAEVWTVWERFFSEQPKPVDPGDAAFPDFAVLQDWSKLRLLRAERDGDRAIAAADVAHLASLAFSTNDSVGAAVAIALRRAELRFRLGRPDAALDAGSRSFRAAAFGPNFLLDPDEIERALEDTAAGPFRCLAVAETAWRALPFKQGLARTYGEQFRTIGKHLTAGADSCRLRALARAWNGERGYEVVDAVRMFDRSHSLVWRLLARAPYVGDVIVELLAVLALPTGYSAYRSK